MSKLGSRISIKTSYAQLEDIVFNLMPEILKNAHDLSSGPERLKSKLYWISIIELLSSVMTVMEHDNGQHLVMDAGCGIGHMSKILSSCGFQVVGIDIKSNDLWKKLQTNNLQFFQSEVLHLPFQERTFDCVGAFAVLEHVKDSHSFLCEVNRVLKKGGVLVISQLPSAFGWTEFSGRVLKKSVHERYYKKNEVLSLLRDEGFQVLHFSYDHFMPQFLPFTFLNKIWNRWATGLQKIDRILSLLPLSHSFNIISRKLSER